MFYADTQGGQVGEKDGVWTLVDCIPPTITEVIIFVVVVVE